MLGVEELTVHPPCWDIVGCAPRRLHPMIVGVPPRVGAAYTGDRPTKLWIKTFDPSNGLQTSVSGGLGVVEIGGISGRVHDG